MPTMDDKVVKLSHLEKHAEYYKGYLDANVPKLNVTEVDGVVTVHFYYKNVEQTFRILNETDMAEAVSIIQELTAGSVTAQELINSLAAEIQELRSTATEIRGLVGPATETKNAIANSVTEGQRNLAEFQTTIAQARALDTTLDTKATTISAYIDEATGLTTVLGDKNTTARANITALTEKNTAAVSAANRLDGLLEPAREIEQSLGVAYTDAAANTALLDSRNARAEANITALGTKNDETIENLRQWVLLNEETETITANAVAAKTALDTSISSSETAKGALDNSIAEAGQIKTAVDDSIANAETKKAALDGSIETSTASKTALDTSISSSETAKGALDNSIAEAGQIKTAVDDSIANAETKKTALDGSIETSTASKTALDESISAGETAKGALNASISNGNTLSASLTTVIANGTTLKGELDDSITEAGTKKTALDGSIDTGTTLKGDLDTSIADAATAQEQANTAMTNANTVKSELNTVISDASTAKTNLETSIDVADGAKTHLESATGNARTVKGELDTAISNANTAKGQLESTISDAGTVKDELSEVITQANTAKTNLDSSIENANTAIQSLHAENSSASSNLEELRSENFNSQEILAGVADLRAYLGLTDDDILGLQVDYKNKTFTRIAGAVNLTAGADFDAFSMYGGRKRCDVADDGTITAWYGDDDYAEDGSMGQVMVYQPKFYYLVCPVVYDPIETGIGYHLRKANYYVSEKPRAGFRLHPAFYDAAGNEIDYILDSAFEGSIFDVSENAYLMNDEQVMTVTTDKFCSIAGAKPASGLTQNLTRPNIEQMAQNRGPNWHGDMIKPVSARQLLMIIELGSMNTQTTIGQSVVSITDNSSYNCSSLTGSTSSLGNGTGMAASTINEIGGTTTTQTADGKTSITWRGTENPWGNIWKFVYGVNIYGNGTMGMGQPYICNDFNFAESRNSGNYEAAGFTLANAGGFISAMGYSSKYDWLFMPSETLGNSSLPVGDYLYGSENLNGYRVSLVGGSWSNDVLSGVFCWAVSNGAGYRFRFIGGRLAFVPTKDSETYNTAISAWKTKMAE